MNYPNKKNVIYQKPINYANRGMDLEELINEANAYYLENNMAVIYKKPTPIGIVKVNYENNKQMITKAYFEAPSTLDYNGVYRGRYLEFDAKNTESKTSFPISNVHKHQINHIRRIINQKGIVFLIIRINKEIYLLNGSNFIKYIDENKRKSIPYEYIKNTGYVLEYNYNKGLDYLKYVDLIGGFENEKN